jgi:hypothetical protein
MGVRRRASLRSLGRAGTPRGSLGNRRKSGAAGVASGAADAENTLSKQSFFEKKDQKTFVSDALRTTALMGKAPTHAIRRLFFKKGLLSSFWSKKCPSPP